jgi:hypothetical protein
MNTLTIQIEDFKNEVLESIEVSMDEFYTYRIMQMDY